MEQTTTNLLAEIEALRAENARLVRLNAQKASGAIKKSSKGAVSVYGLGKFPVTLYASQWEALFTRKESIAQFIVDHMAELAAKPQADA